jgi:hypothetical protein
LREPSNLSDVFGKEPLSLKKKTCGALTKPMPAIEYLPLWHFPVEIANQGPGSGILADDAYIGSMTKPPPSPAQLARNERMRTAAIEGAKARADIEARDIAVRKNMERLRALRLAKEAEEAAQPKPAKAPARGKKAAPKQTAKLSDFLAAQKSNGRTT